MKEILNIISIILSGTVCILDLIIIVILVKSLKKDKDERKN